MGSPSMPSELFFFSGIFKINILTTVLNKINKCFDQNKHKIAQSFLK